ncbi:hypothetical protein E2C01_094416 [Portunus trituberculatus]|uniref:Uncharacterized protein n=1 Tax=Portunus trituberculatus TaxID=210409 RepID=A0A5B7JSD9_PORTR|nr:hypothetical protein [Portunus trituberculatus]
MTARCWRRWAESSSSPSTTGLVFWVGESVLSTFIISLHISLQ